MVNISSWSAKINPVFYLAKQIQAPPLAEGENSAKVQNMRKLIFSLIFVIFHAQIALCADSLSLSQAKKIALAKNPALVAAGYRLKAAQAGIKQAQGRFLPRVDVMLIYQRSDSPIQVFMAKLAQQDFKASDFEIDPLNHPSPRTNLKTAIEITQPIFNQGKEIIGLRKAKKHAYMAQLEKEALTQYVLYQVEAAYTNWILARERVKVLQAAEDTAKANLSLVKAQVENGKALTSDLLRAQVHLAAVKRELLAAKNQRKVALLRLNLVLGLPTDTPWEPLALDLKKEINPGPLATWQEKALLKRPDLALVKEKASLADLEVKQAKYRFYPAINMKGIYEYNAEGLGGVSGDAFTVMAEARFNLFSGFRDKASLAQARAQALAEQAKVREKKNQVLQEVEEAYLALKTSKAQVEVSLATVAQAQEALELIKKRYQNGLATIVDLLTAQTALKQARLELLSARFQERLAWIELRFRAGVLSAKEM